MRLPFAIYYNGNLITGDGKYRIYDGFNHLVQIKNGNDATGTILENITWHPLEERTLVKAAYETNGSWKETVYYISKSFVRVKNTSGTYDYKYIYQNGQLVAQELIGGQKSFILNDHKGTVQVVTNESGAKVEETFYSPFGEIISGGATSRFDYEGKEFDSVVGDYDYLARKVNPQWGMFTSPDTMLPNVYDPQQLNRYAFEKNNPTKYKDDDCHNPLLIAIGISAALGAITEAGMQYYYTGEIYDWHAVGMAAVQSAILTAFLFPLGAVLPAGGRAVIEVVSTGKGTYDTFIEEKEDSKEYKAKLPEMEFTPVNNPCQIITPSNQMQAPGSNSASRLQQNSNSGSSSSGSIATKVVTLNSKGKNAQLSVSSGMEKKLKSLGLLSSSSSQSKSSSSKSAGSGRR